MFSMYGFRMEELIDTKVDLAILEKAKVIENNVGTDQSLVGMWKNMCIDKCYDLHTELMADHSSR